MDDEDEFSLYPAERSRLASLFTAHSTPTEIDVNQSLTYTAPKQPKKNEGTQNTSSQNMALVIVCTVYAYKLENEKYTNYGKIGAAIMGNREAMVYKMLLYKGKQEQITWCSLDSSTKLSVEPNYYASFSDDKGDHWALKFEGEDDLMKFTKQVALCKAIACGKPFSSLIIQDLLPGDGIAAEKRDSIVLHYKLWLYKDGAFGEVLQNRAKKDDLMTIRLSKSTTIKGLRDGLIGVKSGAKRLLIIPSTLGYSSDDLPDGIPSNADLIYEVAIKKVKKAKDSSLSQSPKNEALQKPDVPPRTHSLSNDDSIRSRGASISEQLTQSPRKDNAKIISRMAKMGMPTLPMQSTTTAHTSSESESEQKEIEISNISRSRKASSSSLKSSASHTSRRIESEEILEIQKRSSSPQIQSPSIQHVPSTYAITSQPVMQVDPSMYMAHSFQNHSMAHPHLIPSIVPNVMDAHLPLLVAETRTQNTEVRLSLGRISDKVDMLIQKLGASNSQDTSQNQGPYMEGTILAQNIERIIQENVKLKTEAEIKATKIQELNEKICDILQRNQRFFEESNNILEQRSGSLQTTSAQLHSKILSLEQEKASLSSELTQLQLKSHNFQSEMSASEEQLKQQKDQISNLEVKYAESMSSIATLKSNLSDVTQEKQDLLTRLENAQSSIAEYQKTKQQLDEKMACLSENNEDATKTTIQKLQDKLQDACHIKEQLEKSEIAAKKTIADLEENLRKALHWKDKYEALQVKNRQLKDWYEGKMSEVISELKAAKVAAAQKTNSVPSGGENITEIKRAMNILYKTLQDGLDVDKTYSGNEVLQKTLQVIRRVTFSVIEAGQQKQQPERLESPEGSNNLEESQKIDASLSQESTREIPEANESIVLTNHDRQSEELDNTNIQSIETSEDASSANIPSASDSPAIAAEVPCNEESKTTEDQVIQNLMPDIVPSKTENHNALQEDDFTETTVTNDITIKSSDETAKPTNQKPVPVPRTTYDTLADNTVINGDATTTNLLTVADNKVL